MLFWNMWVSDIEFDNLRKMHYDAREFKVKPLPNRGK